MDVSHYCADCVKSGERQPLKFVMISLKSGLWMCPKSECTFPMSSQNLESYMENDMTTDRVLFLTESILCNKSADERCSGLSHLKLRQFDDIMHLPETLSNADSTSILCGEEAKSFQDSPASVQKRLFPLWESDGLTCWLDASLSLLVLNTTMREVIVTSKGHLLSTIFIIYRKLLNVFNTRPSYRIVRKEMQGLREDVLTFLQPKMLSNSYEEDSPLCSLPLVIKTVPSVYEKLEVQYSCGFKCAVCGFEKHDGFRKMILSLPTCSSDCKFVNNLFYDRHCYRCSATGQRASIYIEQFPEVLFAHFPEGVGSANYWSDFTFTLESGETYIVTQVVQYQHKRKHFLLWCYGLEANLWLLADDIQDPVVSYQYASPQCSAREVHLLVWEKLSNLNVALKTGSKGSSQTPDVSPPDDNPKSLCLSPINGDDMSSVASARLSDSNVALAFPRVRSKVIDKSDRRRYGMKKFRPYEPRAKQDSGNSETLPKEPNDDLSKLESLTPCRDQDVRTSISQDTWRNLRNIMTEELDEIDSELLVSPVLSVLSGSRMEFSSGVTEQHANDGLLTTKQLENGGDWLQGFIPAYVSDDIH